MNWHDPVTTGLNSEEESEKCRTGRRKLLPIITRVSHVKVAEVLPVFQMRNARSKSATKSIDWARFSVLQQKGEQHFRIRVCRNVENVCNSSRTTNVLLHYMYPQPEPSIAPTEIDISRKIQFSVLKSNTQT